VHYTRLEGRLEQRIPFNGGSLRQCHPESRSNGRIQRRRVLRDRDHPLGRIPCKISNTGDSYAQMSKREIIRYSSDREHLVLFSQAWVFQERLLSRRNIFLGGPELSWDCCTTQLSETFPKGMNYSYFSELPLKMSMHATLKAILDTVNVSLNNAQTVFLEF
jgi:hypothetical protein